MVMTGIEKLSGCQYDCSKPVQLYALENVRNDFENYPLLLISQLFLSFSCDLFLDALLPTEKLDHANDIHDLSNNLHASIRLQEKSLTSLGTDTKVWLTIFIFSF